jgi:glycosyltransferase involved in cell wall biosynthesis
MYSTKKKVLLIGSELGKGGAERSISLLSHHLSKDYDVTLCIISGRSTKSYYKATDNIVFINPPEAKNIFGKIKAWNYRIREVKALKKRLDISVSISFLEGPDYVNVLTKTKEKVILSMRGSKQFNGEISGFTGFIRKKILIPLLYKRADHIVCVTDSLATEMQKHFAVPWKKLSVINNFYEHDEILKKYSEPLTKEEATLFNKPVIINSGRLHMQKEQDKLLRVFSAVKARTDCRLLIFGDGKLKDDLLLLGKSLGLKMCCWQEEKDNDADVYLMGYHANPFKFYRLSKIFALSSSWEGFPNVLAEAMICGLPVISADCPTGPREILRVNALSDCVDEPVRTKIGSLMPMLKTIDENIVDAWVEECVYWINKKNVDKDNFEKLTQRYEPSPITRKWKGLINDLRIYSNSIADRPDKFKKKEKRA